MFFNCQKKSLFFSGVKKKVGRVEKRKMAFRAMPAQPKNAKWPSRTRRPGQKTQNGLPGPAGPAKKRKMAVWALRDGPKGQFGQLFLLTVEKSWDQLFFNCQKKLDPTFFFNCQKKVGLPGAPGPGLASREASWLGPAWLARPGQAGLAGLARLGWPGQAEIAR